MRTLIRRADVFDGKSTRLREQVNIVIEDNLIREIVPGDVPAENFEAVYDAKGYTVIPGLVDAHVHLSWHSTELDRMRVDEVAVRAARVAEIMLLKGFTTVRDAGGLTYGVKKCIDGGIIPGPRVFPSNAYISQTCGHGDGRSSRAQSVLPGDRPISPFLLSGASVIADGVPEMLKAAREQLFLGASQIKLMAGGGFSSRYDPIRTLQFSLEEMRAAVGAAEDFGTYVMAHIYTPAAMRRAAQAGVKSFEHATFIDEETARVIQDQGIWICPCPQFGGEPSEEGAPAPKPPTSKPPNPYDTEYIEKSRNPEQATELINRFNLPIVFGTDVGFSLEFIAAGQLKDFRAYKKRFGSHKGLVSATGAAHELLKLSTSQNPYPQGKIGVLTAGAFADLLFVRGNPAEDLAILADRGNIAFIMKDGRVYKDLNTSARSDSSPDKPQ
ncbi:MAG: amidohydrolase family protein [Peptococcaceae bacterium]|nr:amidohydrolase family protein [Peptococcaceae bacterium]